MAIPFPTAPPMGGHIIGQPFTVTAAGVPMNMQLTCNCGGENTDLTIAGSVPAQCPSCQKTYNALFNPTNGKIEMQITLSGLDKVPS